MEEKQRDMEILKVVLFTFGLIVSFEVMTTLIANLYNGENATKTQLIVQWLMLLCWSVFYAIH